MDAGTAQANARVAARWDVRRASLASPTHYPAPPVLAAQDVHVFIPDLALWDIWPVQLDDGTLAPVAGGDLWVMLAAPRTDDPDDRHRLARMRLLFRDSRGWHDCGPLLPDGFSPGSREWSGSTRLDPATGRVTLWFTAAGRRGDGGMSFEQRLFDAVGQLRLDGLLPGIDSWSLVLPSVHNDGDHYADTARTPGAPGLIKGFRDPYWFRDPANGQGYILFTGSRPAGSLQTTFDGVIGMAAARGPDGVGGFDLLPPLVDGNGQVNELERPHVIVHNGQYYLFWSSQAHVFAPGGLMGPTGLYGMVAPSLFGPWQPLNGSGLVLANPASEPRQAYAWQVLPGSLEVISFVDHWGLQGRDIAANPALKAAQFGGTIAPFVRIALDGAGSRVITAG